MGISQNRTFAKIVLIMCYTGMRPQELTRVKKEDVHVENAYFVGGMKTKAGKKRIIPIHQDILPIISVFVQNNKTHLIETSKGKPYSYNLLYYHWRAFMESAGLDHLPHDCRHTFTTFARKKNLDPLLVKRIVGHKSTDLTEQVYTHTDIQDLVTAVNML